MPRMPIQGSPVNPRLRRAFPRIAPAPVIQDNPQADAMARMLAAFQGMFGEPEMPIQDMAMLRAQQLAARQPIGEYDELGTLPDALRGINPARRNVRAAMNMRPQLPRKRGLRYFGE